MIHPDHAFATAEHQKSEYFLSHIIWRGLCRLKRLLALLGLAILLVSSYPFISIGFSSLSNVNASLWEFLEMNWIQRFIDLRLDVVGIIAVLGEASVKRNVPVMMMSWGAMNDPWPFASSSSLAGAQEKIAFARYRWHIVAAYDQRVSKQVNFFAQVLHHKPLNDYQVELVQVTRKKRSADLHRQPASFLPPEYGPLFWVSILGCLMAVVLVALSISYGDRFSLLACIMLSMVSSLVGFGTRTFPFQETRITDDRVGILPRHSMVIFYPNVSSRFSKSISSKSPGIPKTYDRSNSGARDVFSVS